MALIPAVPGREGHAGLAVVTMLAACWAVTGALLVTARPRNVVGWLVLLCGVLQAWSNVGIEYGGYGVAVADPMWPLADWVALSASMIYFPSLLLPVSVILALYPDGRLPSRRWRVPVLAVSLGLAVLTVAASLTPEAYDDIAPGRAPLSLPAGPWAALAGVPAMAWVLGGTLAIWVMTGFRLGRARPPERAQLAWYVATVVPCFVLLFFSSAPIGWSLLGGMSMPVAIAIGVLRYRMLDIVLRPLLVYGGLTAVVVATFVAVSALAGTTMQDGPVPGVVAAGLVAVGLSPARDRVQRGVDRFVYGERRDPMRAVVTLGDRVESAQPQALLELVLASVADAVRAPGASVTDVDGHELAVFGDVPSEASTHALVVTGQPVGTLRVAPRTPGSGYSAADARVLGALTPQVAVVVHALDLAKAVEAQRDRVVLATRSERDRLRRELHDGLGPALAGTGLGLQAARDALAASDTDTLRRLLDRLGTEVDLMVLDVRRIIDDLRPAALDDGDLGLAIRRRADAVAPVVAVDVEVGELPDLRPEVEDAAYRITSEALNNISRHADARQVRVAMAAVDGFLTVRIADDGSGIAAEAAPGVGLASMRRRAEAVGGSFELDSSEVGTRVTARLPL